MQRRHELAAAQRAYHAYKVVVCATQRHHQFSPNVFHSISCDLPSLQQLFINILDRSEPVALPPLDYVSCVEWALRYSVHSAAVSKRLGVRADKHLGNAADCALLRLGELFGKLTRRVPQQFSLFGSSAFHQVCGV